MLNEKLLSEGIADITKKAQEYKVLGIITSRDLELIIAGLNLIKKDFEAGVDLEIQNYEDILPLIEEALCQRIGQAALKLNTCVA